LDVILSEAKNLALNSCSAQFRVAGHADVQARDLLALIHAQYVFMGRILPFSSFPISAVAV